MTALSSWVLAVSLWLGCLAPSGPLLLAVPFVLLAGAVAAGRPAVRLAVLAVALAAFGAVSTGVRAQLADGSALAALADRGGEAALTARVVTEPRVSATGWWLVVRVTSLDGVPVRERASVMLDRRPPPALGDEISLRATARPLDRDGFDGHLRRLHAVAALDPIAPPSVDVAAGSLWRATSFVRDRTRAVAGARLDDDQAAVLTGLLTGDSRDQRPELRARMAAAGLAHLVVVSGRHVGLMLAGVLGCAALLGAGARGRRLVALGSLASYVLLVRWQPSVMRAGVMATLVLGAGLLGRRADPRHSLAMAVVVLLLVDPMLAGQLGFGLSVSATAGVLVLAPWLAERLPGPRTIRLLAAACIGAQVGAAPLLLQLDSGISWASVPANLLAVPAAGAAQAIGLVAALVGLVSETAGGAVAWLALPFLWVILAVAGWAAVASWPAPDVLVSLVVVVAAGVLILRRRAPRLAVASIALVVAAAAWPSAPAGTVEALTVSALAVGQGDAILVEIPDGARTARVLVDGGPDELAALRLLERRGIRRLDAVVVSHPHHDHTGGLPAVMRSLHVGALIVGPEPLDPADAALSAADTERTAARTGVPLVRVAAGDRFRLGEATVSVLSPPDDGWLEDDLNERSVVLHVTGAHGSVLLTGDAEQGAQAWMLRRPELLRADVLKVPHHGGNTSLPEFFSAVGARTALIGVGADNDYGHPHPAVLEMLAALDVHRTDIDGTATVSLGPGGPVVHNRRGAPGRRHYTPRDATTRRVPAHRTLGAPAATGGGRPRRRAPGRGRDRGLRPSRNGPEGDRAAGPAHRVVVRCSSGAHPARGPGARRGRVRGAARRVGGGTA